MYTPKHFEITDLSEIFAFIEANAFGQLISQVEGRLFSSHIPFLVSEDKTRLFGHLARQNPQHLELEGQEILITFQGPHAYISPTWYSSPGVPTWNYQVVHVYGQCTVFDDADRLKQLVDTLANLYEKGSENPWQPDYKEILLNAIVGVEIHISEVQCKYKLSQNRSEQDQKQVAQHLQQQGSNQLADEMIRHQSNQEMFKGW